MEQAHAEFNPYQRQSRCTDGGQTMDQRAQDTSSRDLPRRFSISPYMRERSCTSQVICPLVVAPTFTSAIRVVPPTWRLPDGACTRLCTCGRANEVGSLRRDHTVRSDLSVRCYGRFGDQRDFALPTDINLLAGHEYAIGVVTTGNFYLGYIVNMFGGLPSQTEGGITRLGSDLIVGSGANGGAFTVSPALYGQAGDTRFADAMRIFTPDPVAAPEPLSITVLAAGLLGLGFVRRCRA